VDDARLRGGCAIRIVSMTAHTSSQLDVAAAPAALLARVRVLICFPCRQ